MNPLFELFGVSIAFAWAVFHNGGAEIAEWRICILLVAGLWVADRLRGGELAPPLQPALRWSLLAFVAFSAVQLVPLPPALVSIVSPARAELGRSYAALTGAPEQWAPLSVSRAASLDQLVRIATCVLVLLLVRRVCWRLGTRGWWTALPLVFVAAAQAALGLVQYCSGEPAARGSYVNRNHFAGLLEMAVPFAIVYPATVIRRSRVRWRAPLRPALLACAGIGAALLILLALLHSLSRMGFTAGLVAVIVSGTGLIWAGARHRFRGRRAHTRIAVWISPVAIALAVVCCFSFLLPDALIARFGQLHGSDGVIIDRTPVWRASLPLLRAYLAAGCGLGGYESSFMRHKVSGAVVTDDFAHNDYLQYLIELGIIGFVPAAIAIATLVLSAGRAAVRHTRFEGRCVALACLAAFAAILLHSTVEFNLYVPANSLSLSWIGGMASAILFSSHPAASPEAVEVRWVSADQFGGPNDLEVDRGRSQLGRFGFGLDSDRKCVRERPVDS